MKQIKTALFLGLLGIIAGAFVVPFQLDSLKATVGEVEYTKMLDQIPVPFPVFMIVAAIQVGLLTTVLGWIGLILKERVGLSVPLIQSWLLEKKKPVLNSSGVKLAVIGGILGALFIVFADVMLFQPHLPKIDIGEGASWWKAALAGVLYGGIVEEVLVRLFLMTFIVWVLSILFKKNRGSLPSSFYWIGLIVASLVFAAGHLPANQAIFGDLTPLLVVRVFVLNGVLGFLFGYLYWKKGLEYAMFSHMTVHLVTQIILIPIIKLVS